MKMNPKAQVFRLFFLFDGASLLPFPIPYDWPPVNHLRKRHQGENPSFDTCVENPPGRSLSPSVTPGQRTGKRAIERIEKLNKENFIARNGRFH